MESAKIEPEMIPNVELNLLGKAILDAMEAFYDDPANQAAFAAWRKAEEAANDQIT